MLLAVGLGLVLHLAVMFAVDNKPLAHAAHGEPTGLLALSHKPPLLFCFSCYPKLAAEYVK